MANERLYEDLRKMQKRANQRMVRLEKAGYTSPAYQAVQAKLEILGRQVNRAQGRRFKETGVATYNEYEMQKKILEEFLGAKTSTVSGAKNWESSIYETSDIKYGLSKTGINKKDWAELWSNMPSDHKDRVFGSEVIIRMVRTYSNKRGKGSKDEQRMSIAEIAEAINTSKSVKDAHKKLGITYRDIKETESLGELRNPFDNEVIKELL